MTQSGLDVAKWTPVTKGAATLKELECHWSYDDLSEYLEAVEVFGQIEAIYDDCAELDRKDNPTPAGPRRR